MSNEFLNFLESDQPKEEGPYESLMLNEAEKAYVLLNAHKENFHFRFPDEADLRTITDKFRNEECFLRLQPKITTLLGNVNVTLNVQVAQGGFNNHTFLKDMTLGRLYVLDFLDFPKDLPENKELDVYRAFDKAIRSNQFIKRKKDLLEQSGYIYIIHYDANKLVHQVIEDVRKLNG